MGEHVLVPVDGSSQSAQAVEYVLEKVPDPEVTLLHVIGPTSAFGYADEFEFDMKGYQQEVERRREKAERMLEEFRADAATRGVDAETVIVTGRPAKQIIKAAEDRDVDQIVMGSHGRSGVGRVVFGTVAETVTRRSPVPVTIVR